MEEPIKEIDGYLIKKDGKVKRFFLYIFWFMEGIGGLGLIYGAIRFLIEAFKLYNSYGLEKLLFYIGLSIVVTDFAVKMLNRVGIELKILDLEGKQ